MTTALQDYFTALRRLRIRLAKARIAACKTAIAKLSMPEDEASVAALTTTETAVAFAAKRLVRAVDELPPERRPKGWGDG